MPACPWQLAWVWDDFCLLAERRTYGMAANPITYENIEAFERKTFRHVGAWETALLMRMDSAARSAWRLDEAEERAAGNRRGRAEEVIDPARQIPASDVKTMKTLFRSRLGAKRA